MALLQREFLPSNDTYKTKTSAGNTLHFIRGNENVTHSAQGETDFFGGEIFCLEYPSTRSEKGNVHFANYRFSFRKLQIFISQTTDFHFANYRFPFRKLQILISQTTDFHFHFVSSHFVSQTTVSRLKTLRIFRRITIQEMFIVLQIILGLQLLFYLVSIFFYGYGKGSQSRLT